jgi:signal transduction histidine kinase
MRNLIREILLFSQIKKEETRFLPVNLNEVAAGVLKDHEIVIQQKGASVTLGLLPEVTGDHGMISQVFSNIIGNALKYTRDGISPTLAISQLEEKDSVVIAFVDNGIGFDETFLPKMFTLFQRLHSREKYEGTGLGLAICRKIMEFHRGEITAKGLEDSGATFYIRFPKNLYESS